jgi:hypothetical protein
VIKNGSSVTLEFRLIPSSVLKAEAPDVDVEKTQKDAQQDLDSLNQAMRKSVGQSADNVNIPDLKVDFEVSWYRSLKLEPRKNPIETVSVKLTGDGVTATSLTAETQTVKPFVAKSCTLT